MSATAPAALPALVRMRWWDIAEVHALESEVFGPDAWTVAQFWSELARVPETRWYVLARDGQALVGYAGLFQAGPEADVQTVAVAPAARGRGIGRSLVAALVAEARVRGAGVLHLEVRADNGAARHLYEGSGFRPVGRRTDYYGRGLDAILMSLSLPRVGAGTEVPHG